MLIRLLPYQSNSLSVCLMLQLFLLASICTYVLTGFVCFARKLFNLYLYCREKCPRLNQDIGYFSPTIYC